MAERTVGISVGVSLSVLLLIAALTLGWQRRVLQATKRQLADQMADTVIGHRRQFGQTSTVRPTNKGFEPGEFEMLIDRNVAELPHETRRQELEGVVG